MLREIFIIGIGGQGALTVGEILLNAANKKNYGASFYPFYGSQMRGGEAGCIVKIDTDGNDILNPTINSPDDFIILSDKFFDKYRKFANEKSKYYDIESIGARIARPYEGAREARPYEGAREARLDRRRELSERNGARENTKNLNIIMLKTYICDSKLFSDDDIIDAIKEKFKKEEVYKSKIDIYEGLA